MRAILAVALLIASAAALSQPPTSTPSKTRQEQKTETGKTAKDPKATQDESKTSPLSVTIDSPVTVQKSEQDRHTEARDSEHKASNEWWLIIWTAVLACITLLLAGITAVLARYTYKLWYDTTKASERQSGEMRESLAIAERNAKTAEDNIDLARKEFISTHRPRLIVRRVSVDTVRGTGISDVLKVEFVVANIGDTKAKIIEMSTRIWFPESSLNLPAVPPYGESTYPGRSFESGASGPMTHIDSAEMLARFQSQIKLAAFTAVDGGSDSGPAFLFIGYIVYEDELKRKCRTAFCRIYNFATQRFDPIPHPDYEYQD